MRSTSEVACPTEHTLAVIGGGWKVLIVYYLFQKVRRYSELQRELRGVSPRVLTKQLRELERDDIVKRKVYPEIPPKVEYSLTGLGESLMPVVDAMYAWGERHRSRQQPR